MKMKESECDSGSLTIDGARSPASSSSGSAEFARSASPHTSGSEDAAGIIADVPLLADRGLIVVVELLMDHCWNRRIWNEGQVGA